MQEDDAGEFGRHSTFLADRNTRYRAVPTAAGLAFLISLDVTVTLLRTLAVGIPRYPEPLVADLVVSGSALKICNVHLSLESGERAHAIANLLSHGSPLPDVICGDFNEESDQGVLANIAAAGFDDVGREIGPTMPAESPAVRLDHILLNQRSALELTGIALAGSLPDVSGAYASDHLGLLATAVLPRIAFQDHREAAHLNQVGPTR